MTKKSLTIEELRSILHYDPDTGVFTWKNHSSMPSRLVGKKAGSIAGKGYLGIKIHQKRYQASRLAWFYVHGEWPLNNVDHIDGNRTNNSIKNLRDVTQQINAQNIKKAYSNNKNGYLGVIKRGCRWVARLYVNGQDRWIGTFDTPDEAHRAYMAEKRISHEGCTI